MLAVWVGRDMRSYRSVSGCHWISKICELAFEALRMMPAAPDSCSTVMRQVDES